MRTRLCFWLWLGFFAAGSMLSGDDLAIDGNFLQLDENGKPTEWVLHGWEGFQPFATLTAVPQAGQDGNAIRISEATAESGACVRTAKRFPGRSGDRLRIQFRARGVGQLRVGLYYHTERGEWNQTSAFHPVDLRSEWQSHVVTMELENGTTGETSSFNCCFSIKRGMEFELASVKIWQESGAIRGNLNLPGEWTVFAPVDRLLQPAAAELLTIPAHFGGAAGQTVTFHDHTIDLAPLVGGPGKEKSAWLFGELNSPIECDYTLGAAADWWMEVYLNGKKIIDTMDKGNDKSPYAIDNHVVTTRLQKGRNILAARVVTGAASSIFMLGGPNDLRNIRSSLKINRIAWIEDFNGQKPSCRSSAPPELIQGNPTPGLLTVTGQAVYTTADTVTITPPELPWAWPGNDDFWAASIRIQGFGQTPETRADANFAINLTADNRRQLAMRLEHQAASDQLRIVIAQDQEILAEQELLYQLLPADFIIGVNQSGEVILSINSLVDSSSTVINSQAAMLLDAASLQASLNLKATGNQPAQIVVDNFIIGQATAGDGFPEVPFQIERAKTFDPVQAGWKLAFSDEFNDGKLDLDKWYFVEPGQEDRIHFEDGKLVITADWNDKKTRVRSASLYTHQEFLYGYFEARIRFRHEHGWWSAFWLCSAGGPSNPFHDGLEIDIYEDYYLRSKEPGGEPRRILDHNLHLFAGCVLKSWNYRSILPGSLDDYYVIACKWTPFEISYYLDGQLIASSATVNHSPYNSVTYDAIHHAAGASPLRAILSGCCGRAGGDPAFGNFPEDFRIDYVRIYAYPDQDSPKVTMTSVSESDFMLPPGTRLRFSAQAEPSPQSLAPIQAAYLFDSGFLLDYKTKPPFDFEVLLTKEYYDTTRYVAPGRAGRRLEFGPTLHAYSVFVQDANGRVAHTTPVLKFIKPTAASTPYLGKPQVIPGRLLLPHYDEGGPQVAYVDSTPENVSDKSGTFRPGEQVDATKNVVAVASWEWLKYTVEVEADGIYQATLRYGTPRRNLRPLLLLVDDVIVGEFSIPPHKFPDYRTATDSVLANLRLTAGRHVLTLIPQSGANLAYIDFALAKP
jgi:hypothetical protein